MKLTILYEDTQIVVCYKPSGVPVQTSRVGAADMVSLLKNYLYQQQKEKKEPYVAVIHRLDQPVEGVLVFAKTPFAAKELSAQLQKHSFGKYYQAVVCGVLPEEEGTLTNYLIKDGRTNLSRVGTEKDKDAKKAVLHYRVERTTESEGETLSLVRIQLETGRHHQIRVQMAAMDCPIWGDAKYNQKQETGRRQIALCAYRLEFLHPKTKKEMSFEIAPEGKGFVYLTNE